MAPYSVKKGWEDLKPRAKSLRASFRLCVRFGSLRWPWLDHGGNVGVECWPCVDGITAKNTAFSHCLRQKTFEVDGQGVTLTCGPNVTLIFYICCFLKRFPKFLHTKRLNSVTRVAKYFVPVILLGSFKIAEEMWPSGTASLEVEAVAGHPWRVTRGHPLWHPCFLYCCLSSGPDADVQPPKPPRSAGSFTRTGIFCSGLQVPAVPIPFPKRKFVLDDVNVALPQVPRRYSGVKFTCLTGLP